jgi:peptidyl-dipeptidase A
MLSVITILSLLGCSGGPSPDAAATKTAAAEAPAAPPTVEEAEAFIRETDAALKAVWIEGAKAQWTYATDITDAHAAAAQKAEEQAMAVLTKAIADSKRFLGVEGLSPESARMFEMLRRGSSAPAPDDAAARAELAGLLTALDGMYGKGESCVEGDCKDLRALELMLRDAAKKGDYDAQLEAWTRWRTISPPMREKYVRFASLANQGAKEIGYDNLAVAWQSKYDMAPEAFVAEVERLWGEVRPLYEQLHCHVRASLSARYGEDKVPPTGPIPAHLLGNMWAQSWDNLYETLTPFPAEPGLDVTAALVSKGYDHLKMVQTAEGFFTGLGLKPLPPTFYERSMFLKPEGKDVQCHASAWDLTLEGDVRIKMCIKVDEEDFETIHHELGHNYYYLYYNGLPALLQEGANDGFHEGIGDTLALSMTPGYLKNLGILDEVSSSDGAQLNKLMQVALGKVAFLPFGLLIDKWRWQVFSGELPADRLNEGWWALRQQYQGIAPPVARTEADFDPGAKYHIPGNTPYMRYFLSHILQFQFHAALCEAAGHEGPLHTCSIQGSKAAGAKLAEMLSMGASKPWPDALEAIAGTRELSAAPLRAYFEPLSAWLATQNEGRTCGW